MYVCIYTYTLTLTPEFGLFDEDFKVVTAGVSLILSDILLQPFAVSSAKVTGVSVNSGNI